MSSKNAAVAAGGDASLELQSYAPFFISNIANRWTAVGSREYLKEFGIGVAEWRVLASLSVDGEATSLEVVTLINMDAAAVSRAMKNLETKGLVTPVEGRFRGRNKPFAMTDSGLETFLRMKQRALARERTLLQALSDEERTMFITCLRKVHSTLGNL